METIIAKPHPRNELTTFDTNLIGLHVHQIKGSGFGDGMMDLFAMASRTITPTGH
ncbi:hypothetical protein ccbrp13_41550 [Ktedonobacteria bacterium brp13]|nr:hypothetical protein ccbrp13_41550 [Ktedonobacteria bacterium brp13]